MIRQFLRWARGLFTPAIPKQAARPEPLRIMHLAVRGAPACARPPNPVAFLTIEADYVTCLDCREFIKRRNLYRATHVR